MNEDMAYLSFFIAFVILYVILKVLSLPVKIIIKLLANALIGGVVLFLINLIGTPFGLVLDITWLTSVIVGFFGVPGVIIVMILQLLL